MMYQGCCTRSGVLFLLICLVLFESSTSNHLNVLQNLHDELFNESSYNKLFRPNNQVTVFVRYNLQYLNSVDIKTQVMSTTGWFDLVWFDSRLVWNSSSYGGIDEIYVPEDLLWHPDLVILNSIQALENFGAERTIRIYKTGYLRWEPIAVLSTSCAMIVAYFPFDKQGCSIELASMALPSNALNLTFATSPISLGFHDASGDWEVLYTEYKPSGTYQGEAHFSELNFKFVMKRLPGHYLLIVILPTILTAILTFITFFLPLKSGTRIGYIVTVVLALVVLLTLFADTIPSAARYPSILVAIFTVTLRMAFLLIIITIFVMRLYNKPKNYTAPKFMHSMVRKIRKLKSKIMLKCKCRARRINHLEQNQPIEDGRPTDEIKSVEESTPFKPYSNQELADFFDNFLFVVFTVLYILILASAPIVATIWSNNSKTN